MKPQNYPFFFFGAGIIRYYNVGRADVYIKFLREPSFDEVRKILDIAPKCICERDNNCFREPERIWEKDILWVFNSRVPRQFHNPKDVPDEFFATYSKEVEEWLLVVHEICPIETAARGNCYSKGWNSYSAWHEESMAAAADLLKYWQEKCKKTKYLSDMADTLITLMSDEGLSNKEVKKLNELWAINDYSDDGGSSDDDSDDDDTDDDSSDDDDTFNSAEAEATAAMPAPDYSALSYDDIMTAYREMSNHGLVPLITEGLVEGLKVYRKATDNGDAEDINISIDLNTDNGVMSLYYGEDECEGKPFFRYNLGATLKICAAMLKAAGANEGHALSNWFEDAVPKIPKKAYNGLDVVLWVPDVGGDPYLENI